MAAGHGVHHGVATNLTVEQTARHGTDLGFTVYVVGDCVMAVDEATHLASLGNLELTTAGCLTAENALAQIGKPPASRGEAAGLKPVEPPALARGPVPGSTTRSTGRRPCCASSRNRSGGRCRPGGGPV